MPEVAWGVGAYRKDNGNMVEFRLVNMFLEQTPTDKKGMALLSRQGLEEYSSVGTGPITGLFSEAGVFDGDVFAVSGGALYRGEDSIGAIVGNGPVSFAASDTELAITAGGNLYRYSDADGLDVVSFPDSAATRAVEFHDGLFLAVRDDSQRFYFSAVLDADSWDGLDYASAERRPDALLDAKIINDTLVLLGASTIELHFQTGNADAPYQRVEQRTFSIGVYDTGCAQVADNTLVFVGSDGWVYRLGEVPQRISDHGIEERIEQSARVSTFVYKYQGHNFFAVRLDDGTWQFDLATGQWSELKTWGRDNFRGRCAVMLNRSPLFGDDETGTIWQFGGWEDAGEPLERLFTAGFPVDGGQVTIHNLGIEANVGQTPALAGAGSDPVAEMRSSRDAGNTWRDWRSAELGSQGEYRRATRWRRCGDFDEPGGLFEIRTTDPVPFRISKVKVNEPVGGRSR